MAIKLRAAAPADHADVARIIFEAFAGIDDQHNFARDFPTLDAALQLTEMLFHDSRIYGVIAESEGKAIGSNFLWEHDEISAVGPITVDPRTQATGVGRMLMQNVIERGRTAPGIRLVQAAYNCASMSLYTSLGFDIKEPLVLVKGKIKSETPTNIDVRRIGDDDVAACDALHREIHGFSRLNETKELTRTMPGFVARRADRIIAYASCPNVWAMNHSVAETDDDLQALLAAAFQLSNQPLAFLLPTRQTNLFRWCLANGLRVVKPMTLMAMGTYQKPRGTFTTSVLY